MQAAEDGLCRLLGPQLIPAAVIVGSHAMVAALGESLARTPRNVDVSVDAQMYHILRGRPDWQEVVNLDNVPLLRHGAYMVGNGWGRLTHEGLLERSWHRTHVASEEAVALAGLPDVYAWKQEKGRLIDAEDMARIRARLHDPSLPPLPAEIMPHELAQAVQCLPGHLREGAGEARSDAWIASRLVANGLHTAYTLYGHPNIGRANQIIGELELPDYGAIATYHNGFGLIRDLHLLQRHLKNISAPDGDLLNALAADPYTDIVYGNGRGKDERLSADLLYGHAMALGMDARRARRLREAVIATTFDEHTRRQAGAHHSDPLVRAVLGVDLQTLAEPESLEATFAIAFEDGVSARFSPDRPIGRVVAQYGVLIGSLAEGLMFMDEHLDERPAHVPNAKTLREWMAWRLSGNADFHDPDNTVVGHQYPSGWTLDNRTLRRAHARELRDISRFIAAGGTLAEAFARAHAHTEMMRAA